MIKSHLKWIFDWANLW